MPGALLTCRRAVSGAYTRRISQRGMTTGVEERETRQRVRKRARTRVSKHSQKFCSECGAESAPASRWVPAAGGDRAWAVRTGSGPMRMCGDIFCCSATVEGPFADDRTSVFPPSCCRGCGCGGRGVGVAEAGRASAWESSGRVTTIFVRVFNSVSHL